MHNRVTESDATYLPRYSCGLALLVVWLVGAMALVATGQDKDPPTTGWTATPQVQTSATEESLSYAFFIPQTAFEVRYPLVIHLHGNGAGNDALKAESALLRMLSTPAWETQRPCFIMSPACAQTKTQPNWVNTMGKGFVFDPGGARRHQHDLGHGCN